MNGKKLISKLLLLGKKFFWWIIPAIAVSVIGLIILVKYDSIKENALSTKYIAVITSESDPNFTIPKEFKHGFGDKSSILTSKNQKILIEHKDDQLSEKQANIIADKLINDDNCVMIIGNSNSTLSDVTLNAILNSDKRPVFILPIASADNLIEKSISEGYKSILRMIPDNSKQASIIIRFILNKINEKAKVSILVDEENQAYSNNLSKNIASGIIKGGANIVLNKFYGNNNRFIPEYATLKRINIIPDVIVYVGVSSNGMLLIEELKTLNLKIPVIFTDGCTVEELMIKANQSLGNYAYFLSAVTNSENGVKPTYDPIGKDALKLAEKILDAIEGPINRQNVSKYIEDNKGNIKLNSGEAGQYEFQEDGNNKKMNFKIYTYQNNGILTEVNGIK